MEPVTTVRQGRLQGIKVGEIHSFLGVPYAKAPQGMRRWRPPEPMESWGGVRPANRFGPIAIQTAGACFTLRETRQSEDCLSLNVWTASLDRDARQPVMVWVHGGGYLGGAGSEDAYDGASLARRGVTVVTMNYRLGAFGFLAHPDAGANFGVLDVLASLEWVAENIAAFGGDAGMVTVFGQSAGADAIRTLLAMSSARGLFHRAVLQSAGFEPSAVGPARSFARTQLASEQIMEMVGAKTIDELRGVPTDTMRKASHAVSGVIPQPGKIHTPANLVWVPVPDDLVAADSFPGWPDDLPVLMGCTENEARYFIKPGGPQLPFPRNIAIAMLNWIKPGGVYSWAIVERIVAGIAGGRASEVSALLRRSGKKPYECLDWLMTSIIFKEPLHESTQRFMGLNRTFYCYDFARVSPGERRSRLLAQHTSEIRYLFGNLTTDGQYDETDRKIAEVLQSAWTSFARTGVPRSTDGAAWPAFESAAPRYMTIGDELLRRPYASSDMVRLVASLRDA